MKKTVPKLKMGEHLYNALSLCLCVTTYRSTGLLYLLLTKISSDWGPLINITAIFDCKIDRYLCSFFSCTLISLEYLLTQLLQTFSAHGYLKFYNLYTWWIIDVRILY